MFHLPFLVWTENVVTVVGKIEQAEYLTCH